MPFRHRRATIWRITEYIRWRYTVKKTLFTGLIFASLFFSFPSVAADMHEHNHEHGMHQAAAMSSQLIDGVVRRVDLKRSKITLKHGEIAQIQMPAMTMSYQVKDAHQLNGMKKGDKVRFSMEMADGKYVVTHIEHAR